MAASRLLDELGSRLSELAANSPAKDIEKNVRALLSSGFSRLDLVTREEFEVQGALLERAQEKIAELEKRVATLEAAAASASTGDSD